MKKKILLFSASLLLIASCTLPTLVSAQTELWSMTTKGGDYGGGAIFKINKDGSGYTRPYDFVLNYPGSIPDGSSPCQASNGKLYGMTLTGGSNNAGNLFSFDPATNIYVDLVDFTGANGSNPSGKLIQASNGLLYGVAAYGGSLGYGVLFSVDPASNAYTKLFDFDNTLGANPSGSLMQASNALLYGTTTQGGANGDGVLFSFDPLNPANPPIDLFDFNAILSGAGSLMQASNGLLYGMAGQGGANSDGALFSFDPLHPANPAADVFNFNGTNGISNASILMQASNGLLYGMTATGGANGQGVLFSFDPSPANPNPYIDAADFNGTDGASGIGGLIQASNGLLYGMTTGGGVNRAGNIFSFDPLNPINPPADLFDFNYSNADNGIVITAGLIKASNGQLYGMTTEGGINSAGVLFSFDPTAKTYTKQLDFNSSPGGYFPEGSLMQSPNGLLYGTAETGGAHGFGAVFSFDRSTNTYTDLVIFNGANGKYPTGSLIQAGGGLLYGTTAEGGANSQGLLFNLDPTSNTYTDLFDFNGSANGGGPRGSLMQATNGLLYGMTLQGGANGYGVIFSFDPANPANPPVDMHDFDNIDGAYPYGNLIQATDGKLYGMTTDGGTSTNGFNGVLFSFDPTTTTFSKLVDFNGPNGSYPFASLVQASNGLLYGMTGGGGANNDGELFSFDPANPANPPVHLVDFNGSAIGASGNGVEPQGSLMQATNGLLYGMTNWFDTGANNLNNGVIFSFDPGANVYTKLRDINLPDGTNPAFSSFIEINSTASLSITTGTVPASLCAGSITTVSWAAGGVFNADNVFTAQLSDAFGSFANPVNVGSAFTTSGIIDVTIPVNTLSGTGYRIQIVSSDPVVTGSDNGNDIAINSSPSVSITPDGPTSFCTGGSVDLDAGPGYSSYLWSDGTTNETVNSITSSSSYTVTVLNAGGCPASASTTVTVLPLPTATVSGGDPSPDVSIALTGTAPWTLTYSIEANPTTVTVNQGDPNPYVISGAAPGVYTATALSDANCTGTFTGSATITSNAPLPTATVNGGGTVCKYASLPDVSIALTGTAPWVLTYTTDGNPTTVTVNPGDPNPYVISGAAAGIYIVTALSDANGAGTSFTGSATVAVNPLPTATASGGGTVCAGAALPNVSIALTGTAPWSLTYAINGVNQTPLTGITVNSYIIAGATAGVYTISALSDANCAGDLLSTGNATVTVNPLPSATLSGGGTVCAGATLPNVSIALTGTAPWALTYAINGVNQTPMIGIAANPYIITGAAAGIYTLSALSDANCTGNALLSTGSATVTISPSPIITTTSPGSRCGVGTLTLGATASAGTVNWYTASTAGSAIATGSTYTTPSISTTTTYYVDATNSGCTTGSRTAVAATVNTLPAPTVTVTTQPTCLVPTGTITITAPTGTGVTYSIDGSTYTNTTGVFTGVAPGKYQVSARLGTCVTSGTTVTVNALSGAPAAPVITVVNNCGNSVLSTTAKGTLLWSTGATTSSITVTAVATYSVTTTVNGCTSAAGTHAAAPLAIPPTPVITVVNNCGSSVLSTTAKGSLRWTYGYTTSSITATTAGTYLVIATVNGCTSLPGQAVAAPSPFPDKPAVTVVNNCGSSELYAEAQGILKWSTGETGIFITVTVAKTYSVTVTNEFGCTSAAGTGTAAPVKNVPSTAGAITGNSTGPCNNTSPFTYSIAAVPGATSYIWQLPSGCTTPSITTTVPNIEVTFTPLALTGYMFVQASNACGAGNASNKKITLNCPGKWTPLTNKAPHNLEGVLTLLSDGTVLAKSSDGGGVGNVYDRLTPVNGSYSDGKWDSIAPMHETRLWYSSQVLKDGRLYVAGGEYGSGKDSAEVYDPLTGLWTSITNPNPTFPFEDANSEVLDNGDVLQSSFVANSNHRNGWQADYTFDPTTNKLSCCSVFSAGNQDESTWVKLPDGSILMVDDPDNLSLGTDSSERYIPSLGNWVPDATVPVQLYDIDHEEGPAFLLPDGRAFFIGAGGHTAYYTPSGSTANGSWVQGPDIPNKQGTPDAPAAMMVNGKILCIVSPIGTKSNGYPAPVSFYEFDYLGGTNGIFTQVPAPGNPPGDTLSMDTYSTIMLDLPDGNVLLGFQSSENHTYYNPPSSKQYYIYTPGNGPLPAGKPIINGYSHCASLMLTGTLFNGISEGACFGDDDQMSTNRPLVRLTNGSKVYYCRTFNWNHTGVQRGSEADTVEFTLSKGLPIGPAYSLVVVANGIASDPISVSDFTLDIPPAPGAITGNTNPCYNGGIGSASFIYSISPVTSATSYIWTFDFVGHFTSSYTTTTPSITKTFGLSGEFFLTVQAVNTCGGTSAASPQLIADVNQECENRMSGTAPDGEATNSFVAYPNPAHDKLNVQFGTDNTNEYTLKMTDMTGRLLLDRVANAVPGNNFIEVDLGVFAKGIYVLSFSLGEESRQVRIVVE